MKKGTKVLINTGLCSNCTNNDTFEFCECPEECTQTRIEELSDDELDIDEVVRYDDFSDTHETKDHLCLEDYEYRIEKNK